MPADRRTTRSPLVIAALLAVIVVESTGVVLARSLPVATPAAGPAVAAAVAPVGAVADAVSGDAALAGYAADPDPRLAFRTLAAIRATARPAGTEWVSRSTESTPEPAARTQSKSGKGGDDQGGAGSSAALTGRNKVWIPSLGIRRSVSGFACSSTAYPGNRVYRWGCAGHNNVYLFGHAHSVFKPLHDAYVRGKLKKGMRVLYADSAGRVSTYKVIWWKVVAPDKGGFAYAAQSRPSMTLQTCVGARSQYRLVVRLVRI